MKSTRWLVTIIAMVLGTCLLVTIYFMGCHETNSWWPTTAVSRPETLATDLRASEEKLQWVNSLVFQLKDPSRRPLPVQTCDIVVQIDSNELAATMEKRLTLNLDPTGVVTIPKPFPSQGRIRIWVTVDDPSMGAFKGYKNVAYRISNTGLPWAFVPTELEMSACPVITGVVTDAATGEPVVNAEVAPLHWGHHFNYAKWDKSVLTDLRGRYRFLEEYHEGVAVRHPNYDPQETETKSTNVDFNLAKLVSCRIRVVDPNGNAVPNAVLQSGVITDSAGRGMVRVLPGSGQRLSISHADHHSSEINVDNLSEFEEFLVTMQEQPRLRGRIVDEYGLPLDNGKVEVAFESAYSPDRFVDADGPARDGTWSLKSFRIDSKKISGRLRISVENQVRLIQNFSIDNAKTDVIESRLPTGYQFQANLIAKHPLDTKSMPVAFLYRNGIYWSAANPSDCGLIDFGALPNGSYTLKLEHPLKLTLRGISTTDLYTVMETGPNRTEQLAYSTTFDIENANVDLGEIDMDALGLTPGSVVGQVFATPDESKPLPGWYGYLCREKSGFNTGGVFDYYLEFHLDQQGRFRIDDCPPGTYMIRVSDLPNDSAGEFHVKVAAGKTTEVKVFNSGKSK